MQQQCARTDGDRVALEAVFALEAGSAYRSTIVFRITRTVSLSLINNHHIIVHCIARSDPYILDLPKKALPRACRRNVMPCVCNIYQPLWVASSVFRTEILVALALPRKIPSGVSIVPTIIFAVGSMRPHCVHPDHQITVHLRPRCSAKIADNLRCLKYVTQTVVKTSSMG